MQPLPCILLPLPPRAPVWTVLKLPAVPAPSSRFIVGMDLGENKRRAARSGLVLQCLCIIKAMISYPAKTSVTPVLLASGDLGWSFVLSQEKRQIL